jgi:hypothetical protein
MCGGHGIRRSRTDATRRGTTPRGRESRSGSNALATRRRQTQRGVSVPPDPEGRLRARRTPLRSTHGVGRGHGGLRFARPTGSAAGAGGDRAATEACHQALGTSPRGGSVRRTRRMWSALAPDRISVRLTPCSCLRVKAPGFSGLSPGNCHGDRREGRHFIAKRLEPEPWARIEALVRRRGDRPQRKAARHGGKLHARLQDCQKEGGAKLPAGDDLRRSQQEGCVGVLDRQPTTGSTRSR